MFIDKDGNIINNINDPENNADNNIEIIGVDNTWVQNENENVTDLDTTGVRTENNTKNNTEQLHVRDVLGDTCQ